MHNTGEVRLTPDKANVKKGKACGYKNEVKSKENHVKLQGNVVSKNKKQNKTCKLLASSRFWLVLDGAATDGGSVADFRFGARTNYAYFST
ncbi:hypothetical protein T11_10662 [Trichinella zimbabwensis]|uniref:Uncharacterized protein n=1 Tax=Trichinella zimbabwensis TaxID=268475 RepID=A0A0V1GPI1_9BILA|nr:hypothetical protein T11_6765 [Trichinella zimbabwensis]KRZ01825.1 hypothetical protein T11_10662 [Trichinella zimbabwensis]